MRAAAVAGAGLGAWRLAEGTAQGLPWGLASGGDVNLGRDKNKLNMMSRVKPVRPMEGRGGYNASRSARLRLPCRSRKEKHFAQRPFLQPQDLSSCAGREKGKCFSAQRSSAPSLMPRSRFTGTGHGPHQHTHFRKQFLWARQRTC